MMFTTTEKGVDELQRIELMFQEQHEALRAEAARVNQRLAAWHKRRDAIDQTLRNLRLRLQPTR